LDRAPGNEPLGLFNQLFEFQLPYLSQRLAVIYENRANPLGFLELEERFSLSQVRMCEGVGYAFLISKAATSPTWSKGMLPGVSNSL
jgi:hypothetical protein